MSAPLNLASRPFRNERLPALLLGLGLAALAGVTIQHVLVIRRLLPSRTSALHQEVAALDAEAARLRSEADSLRRPPPDPATVKRWADVKGLVDRRAFSWTDLFARLEDVLPPGVRLLSIAPDVREGAVRLQIEAVARSTEDALEFLRTLQQRPEFADANVLGMGEDEDGVGVSYSMSFVPSAAPAPRAEGES